MWKSNPPRWWSKSSAISRYAIAILSVGIAIVVAHLLTVFLHTEPIASLMIAAVMFVAWFGGFGPGLLAIARRRERLPLLLQFFDPPGLGRAGERAAKRRCLVRIPCSVLLLHSDISTFKRK
jgi:hypothetical protein